MRERGGAGGCLTAVLAAPAPVAGPLSELAAAMRAPGLAGRSRRAAGRPPRAGGGRLRLARGRAAGPAGRAVLPARDLERFELAFVAVFGDGRGRRRRVAAVGAGRDRARGAAQHGHARRRRRARPSRDSEPVPAAWSEIELLHEKDFARYTRGRDGGRPGADRAGWPGAHPTRLSRRTRASRRREHMPDLRQTVHASLRTGGEPVHRRWRAPTRRPRQLVLVCDVSGSMAPYARMLLQYMHACVAARRRVEAFAFGTRLTRITHELAGRDHDRALDRAAAAVTDFSGGTRIGAALAELNRVHGRRLGRGAVVVILSDGWDRGDPEQLDAEMARLRRAAHRLVWLNPLAAHPDYEPLTRGMRAAVPHTDELLAGNSLASLEQLAEILEEM